MRSSGSAGEPPAPSGAATREHAECFITEDAIVDSARERGQELGCAPIGTAGAAALRFLATVLTARAVVEVGTGTGTSGLCLLRGMVADGVLTSIDVEPEYQRAARRAFTEAGFAPSRYRLIMGQALDVLPRLTERGYDMVFIDAAQHEYPRYLEAGVRLLRPGGVIAFTIAPAPQPHHPSPATSLRALAPLVRDDDALIPLLLPFDDAPLLALAHSAASAGVSASRPAR